VYEETVSTNKSNLTIIVATFPKDALTKTGTGKISHIDKIKKCELSLTINGKPCTSNNSTPYRSHSGSFSQNVDAAILGSGPMGGMIPDKEPQQAPTNRHFVGSRLFVSEIQADKMMDDPSSMLMADAMEEDDEKEFPPLTKEKKADFKKFEAQLKNMKYDDKVNLVFDTIKPKRNNINSANRKIYKCPVYKCAFVKNNANLLKNHIQTKHKKLVELGFDMDHVGNFQWKTELLDFCLMVSKIYPRFVKNIIKEAKKNRHPHLF